MLLTNREISWRLHCQEGVPYCTENYSQYSVITYMGKELKKNGYIYIYKSRYCTPETMNNTTLQINYASYKIKKLKRRHSRWIKRAYKSELCYSDDT